MQFSDLQQAKTYPENLLIFEYVLKIKISEISASCNILIKYILIFKKKCTLAYLTNYYEWLLGAFA